MQEGHRHNDQTGGWMRRWESTIALISTLYWKGRVFGRNYAVQLARFVKWGYRPRPGFSCCFAELQILAKHLGGPDRYRLGGFTQFATDEMRYYAEAAPMRCVVVHEQFISKFGNFGKTLR